MSATQRPSRADNLRPLRWGRNADIAVAVIAPIVFVLLGAASGAVTSGAIDDWYRTLNRPWFTPPNAAFPIAWTILYALMGVSFWRLLRLAPQGGRVSPERPVVGQTGRSEAGGGETGGGETGGRRLALQLFVIQFLLNLTWSPAFFGLRSPLLGVVIIVPLVILIGLTIRTAWPVDRLAGIVLLPYLAWVVYATALATAILILN